MTWPQEPYFNLRQISTPQGSPSTGGVLLYFKGDGKLYKKDASGTETIVDQADVSATLAAHIAASSGVHGATGSVVGTTDTQTLSNKTLSSPIMGTILGANGLTVLTVLSVPNSVNNLSILNNIATGSPRLIAEGSDTNININLVPKGTGTVKSNGVDLATISGTQTLTNKNLTSATNTFPTSLATLTGTQTLTNKTLSTGTTVGAATTDISGGWVGYTPALTATVTNPNAGTGSSGQGAYMQIGKTVFFRVTIVCGTSGTAAGSGTYEISLPVPCTAGTEVLGSGLIWDSATVAAVATAIKSTASTSKFNMFGAGSTAIVSSGIYNVIANRRYEFYGTYEAA